MRTALVVLVMCVWCSAAFAKGTAVDMELEQVPLRDVLRVLADVGKVNIVPVGTGETKVDVRYKRVPWDTALADLVTRSKLASVREGSVILVGDPAVIAARKKVKRTPYRGAMVDLDVQDATGPALSALLTKLGHPTTISGEARTVTQRLARVSLPQAADVLAFAAGATQSAGSTDDPVVGCQSADREWKTLRVVAIGNVGIKRFAVLADGTSITVIGKAECLGSHHYAVKELAATYVTFATPEGDASWALHAR